MSFSKKVYLVFAISFAGCAQVHTQQGVRQPAAVFTGSTFRSARPDELYKGLQVLDCSASFVKSRSKKTYVMTARHCLKFIDNCTDVKTRFRFVENTQTRNLNGYCRKMEIDDKENDVALFEVAMFDEKGAATEVPESSKVCLSDEISPIGTRLEYIHFPSVPSLSPRVSIARAVTDIPDREAKISENCHIQSEPIYCERCRDKQIVQWSNCTVFSNSSGSAVVDTRTNCATGVTHAADPTLKEFTAKDLASNFAVVKLFVEANRAKLESLAIQIGPSERTKKGLRQNSNQQPNKVVR